MLELRYKYYPFFKAMGCLAGFCLAVASVWFYNDYKHYLPGFIILFYPIPFVFMQYFLFKAYYFISIFNDRSVAQLKENKKQLEITINENKDFVLYLRNHSLEEGAVVEAFPRTNHNNYDLHSPGIYGGTGLIFISIENNLFEEDVIRPIIKYIPVFTMHSLRDDRKSVAMRVLTKKSGWFNDVKILINKAKYIIMNFEKPTKGMILELSYIDQIRANDKTLLITSKAGVESLKNYSIDVEKFKWVVIINERSTSLTTEKTSLPTDFLQKIGIVKSDQQSPE